jgi:tRNA (guanine6-N2)-methyltransferase
MIERTRKVSAIDPARRIRRALDAKSEPEGGTFRLGPKLYIAQTQPGFEGVAWEEIAARYAAARAIVSAEGHDGYGAAGRRVVAGELARARSARELARRSVPDRAGMSIFVAPRVEPLRDVRSAEDVFAIVGHRRGLAGDAAALERVRGVARDAPFVEQGLMAHVRMLPGARAGRRLRFRVIARMAGDHEFRRVDFKRAIEQGILDRGDHAWRLSEEASDIEFWATMFADEVILAMRLSNEGMRHREYKVAHMPGSLRPSVAAALGWLSEPAPDDIVLDPLCGAGTVLIERAHMGRYNLLIGSDHDRSALEAVRTNIGPRYKPIELHPWDAVAIPLPDRSVSKIVTNLPWGIQHGSHEENRRLYPRLMAEFKRLVRKGGLIVILTGEMRLMSDLMMRGHYRAERIVRVSILGAPAAVYVSRVP